MIEVSPSSPPSSRSGDRGPGRRSARWPGDLPGRAVRVWGLVASRHPEPHSIPGPGPDSCSIDATIPLVRSCWAHSARFAHAASWISPRADAPNRLTGDRLWRSASPVAVPCFEREAGLAWSLAGLRGRSSGSWPFPAFSVAVGGWSDLKLMAALGRWSARRRVFEIGSSRRWPANHRGSGWRSIRKSRARFPAGALRPRCPSPRGPRSPQVAPSSSWCLGTIPYGSGDRRRPPWPLPLLSRAFLTPKAQRTRAEGCRHYERVTRGTGSGRPPKRRWES